MNALTAVSTASNHNLDRMNSRQLALSASNLSLSLATEGGRLPVFSKIDLAIESGEFVAIVGPSGCGKTMFLNCAAGLEQPTSGELRTWGKPPKPGRGDVGYAFARDSLLPWRTALGNIELSLEASKTPKAERRQRARDILVSIGLEQFADSYRAQLSQGMRQRIALARTLVANPSLLLMDEPFAALDAQTRIMMQQHLLEMLKTYDGTVLLVTHDLAEAITLADRVIVFSRRPARIKRTFQVDLPRPRSAVHLRESAEFMTLSREVWSALADEVDSE